MLNSVTVMTVGRWWKYLPILSCSVLAVGVGLAVLRPEHPISKVKTVDEYWTETGLGPEALEDLVDDETCRSSQRYFLACANAVIAVADRLGLQLTLSGSLIEGTSSGSDATERRILEPWRDFFSSRNPDLESLSFRRVWRTLVKAHMPKAKRSMLTGAALNAFLSVFRDPHTYILPVSFYQDIISRTNTPTSALGIVLARGQEGYYLRKVIEGSPSEKAGLRRGDWVVEVNGYELDSLPPQRLGELLKAEEGEVTQVRIRRGERILDVGVPRDGSVVPSVTWKRLGGERPAGVLTLHKFAKDSCQEVKTALQEMKRNNLKGVLLDLRDNSGGQMDEAACMVSLFLGPKAPAFRIRYLDPSKDPETYFGQEPVLWDGKVAVIVNNGTASAAEILAGSLRDHGRALIVGERTFGKGSFQEGEIWSRNRRIAFFQTKGFYYLPSGYSPQLKGLEPDVPVKFRDAISLREEDQYINPLRQPLRIANHAPKRVNLSECPNDESGTPAGEDPQLSQARMALFCAPIAAGGNHGAL